MPGQIAAAVSPPGQAPVLPSGGDTVPQGAAVTPTPMPFGQLIAALAAGGTTAGTMAGNGLVPVQTAPAAAPAPTASVRAKAALATVPARPGQSSAQSSAQSSPTSPSRKTTKSKTTSPSADTAALASPSIQAPLADPPPLPSLAGAPVVPDHQPPARTTDAATAAVAPGQAVTLEAMPSGAVHPTMPDPAPVTVADPAPQPSVPLAAQPVSMAPLLVPPALPATAPTTRASPAQDSPASARAPVAQVAPVLLSLARSSGGTQHLTIRLDPPELGVVQIRMQQSADAPARIEISVQRPETLDLMLRDQPSLQHTLDQAGVPVEGRHLVFQLDPQGQPDGGANTGGHGRGTASASTTGEPEDEHDELAPAAQAPPRWTRAGLDITA